MSFVLLRLSGSTVVVTTPVQRHQRECVVLEAAKEEGLVAIGVVTQVCVPFEMERVRVRSTVRATLVDDPSLAKERQNERERRAGKARAFEIRAHETKDRWMQLASIEGAYDGPVQSMERTNAIEREHALRLVLARLGEPFGHGEKWTEIVRG